MSEGGEMKKMEDVEAVFLRQAEHFLTLGNFDRLNMIDTFILGQVEIIQHICHKIRGLEAEIERGKQCQNT